jgi:hypothetical protein
VTGYVRRRGAKSVRSPTFKPMSDQGPSRRLVVMARALAGVLSVGVVAVVLVATLLGPVAHPPVPRQVKTVLAANAGVTRALVTESGTGHEQHLIDRPAHTNAYYYNGKLSSLQVGTVAYNRDVSGCFTKSPPGLAPPPAATFVSQLLPLGAAYVHYTYPRAGVIDWSLPPGFKGADTQPHGEMVTDPSTHRVISGTINGTGVGIERITVSYDPALKTPAAPTNLCRLRLPPTTTPGATTPLPKLPAATRPRTTQSH